MNGVLQIELAGLTGVKQTQTTSLALKFEGHFHAPACTPEQGSASCNGINLNCNKYSQELDQGSVPADDECAAKALL